MLAAFLVAISLAKPSHWVTFRYKCSSAHTVKIAGDFNFWGAPVSMDLHGAVWIKKILLPDDGRCEYKLVVDDNWIADPLGTMKIDNGLGSENSVWQGPKYRFHGGEEHRPKHSLTRMTFRIEGREVVVYRASQAANLPILLFGDGPEYERFAKVQDVVENLVEEGRIRPVVIVFVPPVDRLTEYDSGWLKYASYLFGKVLPAVRAATEASDRPKDLYVGGSSEGGVIAFRLAEECPDRFRGGILGQSTFIQWSAAVQGQPFTDISTGSSLQKIAPSTRIWTDWGSMEGGLVIAHEKLLHNLRTLGRPFGSKVTAEGHNWTAWRNRLVAGLIYILGVAPRKVSAKI